MAKQRLSLLEEKQIFELEWREILFDALCGIINQQRAFVCMHRLNIIDCKLKNIPYKH